MTKSKRRLDDRIDDQRAGVSRRTILRGAAGVAVTLPLMESFVPRPARAEQSEGPHPFLLVHQSNGVAQGDPRRSESDLWWPSQKGAMTPSSLAADSGRATSELSEFAGRMLLVNGIDSAPRMGFDGHAGAAANFLTSSQLSGDVTVNPQPGNESIDTLIANRMTPGSPPLQVAAGSGGGNTVLSWVAAGQKRALDYNPHTIYLRLFSDRLFGEAMDAEAQHRIVQGKASVVDFVREELHALRRMNLSKADNANLELHLDSIRDYEVRAPQVACTPLDPGVVEQLRELDNDRSLEMSLRDEVVELHARLIALAFACDDHRAVVFRFGGIADGGYYPDGAGGTQPFNYHSVSHRRDDVNGGNGDTFSGGQAMHHVVDRIKLRQFAHFLRHLDERTAPNGNSLLDESTCVMTSSLGFGADHHRRNLPVVIVGSAGGFWKQGQHINLRATDSLQDAADGAGGVHTSRLMNTFIAAAGVREAGGEMIQTFGDNPTNESGVISELLA